MLRFFFSNQTKMVIGEIQTNQKLVSRLFKCNEICFRKKKEFYIKK
jgi:hypothetical protein